MAEDRTQEPSIRRRLLARERGQVARSPELTGAVGPPRRLGPALGLGRRRSAPASSPSIRQPRGSATSACRPIAAGSRSTSSRTSGAGARSAAVAGPDPGHPRRCRGRWRPSSPTRSQVGGLLAPGLLAPDPSRASGTWRSTRTAPARRLDRPAPAGGPGRCSRRWPSSPSPPSLIRAPPPPTSTASATPKSAASWPAAAGGAAPLDRRWPWPPADGRPRAWSTTPSSASGSRRCSG